MDAFDGSAARRWLVPNVLTCLNLIGGFLAIWQIGEGHCRIAAWMIIVAVLCDMADGKLARKLGSESEFGFQLDSMADLVTSGMAPAILVLHTAPLAAAWRVTAALALVLASAYRLARFNVLEKNERHRLYRGLPAPVAAFTVVGLWFFRFTPALGGPWLWGIVLMAVPLLMVSRIPYRWPRVRFNLGWKESVLSVVKLALTAAMTFFPSLFMLPCFVGYVIRGWLLSLFLAPSS